MLSRTLIGVAESKGYDVSERCLPGKPGLWRVYPVDAVAKFGGSSQVFWRPVRCLDDGVRQTKHRWGQRHSQDTGAVDGKCRLPQYSRSLRRPLGVVRPITADMFPWESWVADGCVGALMHRCNVVLVVDNSRLGTSKRWTIIDYSLKTLLRGCSWVSKAVG